MREGVFGFVSQLGVSETGRENALPKVMNTESSERPGSSAWPDHLIRAALSVSSLSDHGYHGKAHWARVGIHGARLARQYGVSPMLPSLFGLLHDSCRENENVDPGHGPRAAELVEDLARRHQFKGLLTSREIEWLGLACADHSNGYTSGPLAVQVCWDADRLDLGRVGIRPLPGLLCTDAAQDPVLIDRSFRWSNGHSWREGSLGVVRRRKMFSFI